MKKLQKEKFIDFERFLVSNVKREAEIVPLTDEELLEILKNFGPSEEIDFEQEEELISLMMKTHEKRITQKKKLDNPNLIRSLGELLNYFCEFYKISINKFAWSLGLTEKEFNNWFYDRRSPDSLGISRILTISAFINLSIVDMIGILDRTRKLIKIHDNTNFLAGSARAEKDLKESTREEVTLDAMKELLLMLEESQEDEQQASDWDKFKEALLEQAKEELSPFGQIDECYTLRQGLSKTLLNELIRQL